jgi:hypothetical protein
VTWTTASFWPHAAATAKIFRRGIKSWEQVGAPGALAPGALLMLCSHSCLCVAELFRSFDTERDGYLNEHETYLLLVSINQGPENDDSDMDSTYNGIDHDGTPCSACLRPNAVHATNLWLCCSCALLKLMLWLLLPLLPRHRRCVAPCDRLNIQY